ncbi:Gp49 family protein [Celeribacter sp.]|uniref:Gp49 family protein n=1 Tax=Celeribacter sp. TaxID=1890673 RepID=UPI003A9041BC
MQRYIGTKLVNATPMTRQAYNDFRGWIMPADENGADEGYLVEYPSSAGNTSEYDGYVSWSPAGVFETSYTPTAGIPDRITPELIESRIVDTQYISVPRTTLTICVLTLDTGYTVTGESACVDPANYDMMLGRQYAREQAVEKLWPLLGFALAEKRYEMRGQLA